MELPDRSQVVIIAGGGVGCRDHGLTQQLCWFAADPDPDSDGSRIRP